MRCVNFHLIISTLLTYVLHLCDGCSRTPARPKPTPSTVPPDVLPTTTTPFPTSTRGGTGQFDLPCDPDETRAAGCIRGECFIVILMDIRSAHCSCEHGWTGTRCERLDSKFLVLSDEKVKRAGIATGAVAVIILITIAIVYLIIKKRNMRKKRQEERNQANGHACKSLIQEGTVIEHPSYDYTANEKSETNV